MSDDLDDYETSAERAEAAEDELAEETELADAEELADLVAEGDETPFDTTRLTYSGVEEGDGEDGPSLSVVHLYEDEDAAWRVTTPPAPRNHHDGERRTQGRHRGSDRTGEHRGAERG